MAGTPVADHGMFAHRLRGWAVRGAAAATWILLHTAAVLAVDEVPLGRLLRTVDFSTDVSFDSGLTASGERAASARDDCIVTLSNAVVGASPHNCFSSLAATDVDAYHQTVNGQIFLSVDSTIRLANGQIAHPADIIGTPPPGGGSAQTVIEDPLIRRFSRQVLGLPDSANIDAITLTVDDPRLVLSLDATTVVDGELTVQDEDLVRLVGSGDSELFFDGSAHGVAEALDLDAAEILPDGRMVISFDAAGAVPGGDGPVAFADEDLLLFDPAADRWEMLWDASTTGLDFAATDIDAVGYLELVDPTPTATPSAPATSATPATPSATPTSIVTATPTTPPCPGDCNGDRRVVIGELIRGVNISLGRLALAECRQFDSDENDRVTIGELVSAVRAALNSCS